MDVFILHRMAQLVNPNERDPRSFTQTQLNQVVTDIADFILFYDLTVQPQFQVYIIF